jgi:hypothetical protein
MAHFGRGFMTINKKIKFNKSKIKKPPLGLLPKILWVEKMHQQRIDALVAAIGRYITNKTPIPSEWIGEYLELMSGRKVL